MKLTTRMKNGRILSVQFIKVQDMKPVKERRLTDKEMYSLPFWMKVQFILSEHRKN